MAVKQRRQDASCASDERLVWTRESAEQAVKTPNDDEERLEQMSHPKKQGDGTDDAPRKVEWTCLGLHSLAMERSCSIGWRGCSGTTVFPQTQHVRLVRLSLFGCDLTTSISSKGIQGQAMENTVCESAQTDDCAGNHPRSTPSRCFAQRSSRARGLIRGWIQTAWNGLQTALRTGFLPKKVTKEANQQGVSW